jgi:glycosyltransferase involved in cell wall biosynthesis
MANVPLVVFNAQLLAGESSYRSAGISVYIANLLRHLPQGLVDLRCLAFLGPGSLPGDIHFSARYTKIPAQYPHFRVLWEQFVLPLHLRRMEADLLHAPAFVGPLWSPCPQVITVHDLSFVRYPALFKRSNRLYLKTMTGLACRRAAAVIAVSHFTAEEVVRLLNVPSERVHVIHHGVDPSFCPLSPNEVVRFRQQMGLPERFILHVGTLEPRKNLTTLVQAFACLNVPDLHLVLAGGKGWLYEEIFAEVERLGVQDRVHFPGYVPFETLSLWYNAAYIFAYISRYEGFGLPVLEALASGTPTLTAETTSLPEAAGDGALLVPPDNVAAVADGLQRLLRDEGVRQELRQRGLRHAAHFKWEHTVEQTLALYRRVIQTA